MRVEISLSLYLVLESRLRVKFLYTMIAGLQHPFPPETPPHAPDARSAGGGAGPSRTGTLHTRQLASPTGNANHQ